MAPEELECCSSWIIVIVVGCIRLNSAVEYFKANFVVFLLINVCIGLSEHWPGQNRRLRDTLKCKLRFYWNDNHEFLYTTLLLDLLSMSIYIYIYIYECRVASDVLLTVKYSAPKIGRTSSIYRVISSCIDRVWKIAYFIARESSDKATSKHVENCVSARSVT